MAGEPDQKRLLEALGKAKVINVDAALKDIGQRGKIGGGGGNPVADEGFAVLIHQNFVVIHDPGKGLGKINEIRDKAKDVGRAGGGL